MFNNYEYFEDEEVGINKRNRSQNEGDVVIGFSRDYLDNSKDPDLIANIKDTYLVLLPRYATVTGIEAKIAGMRDDIIDGEAIDSTHRKHHCSISIDSLVRHVVNYVDVEVVYNKDLYKIFTTLERQMDLHTGAITAASDETYIVDLETYHKYRETRDTLYKRYGHIIRKIEDDAALQLYNTGTLHMDLAHPDVEQRTIKKLPTYDFYTGELLS